MRSPDSPLLGTKPRILIVDDSDDLRIFLKECLEARDYVVTTASDGETALQLLPTLIADVVFLDVEMGRLSGLDVLAHIREHRFDLGVVLMSATGSEEVAIEALRLGADDYLRKPFNLDELQAALDRAAGKPWLVRGHQILETAISAEDAAEPPAGPIVPHVDPVLQSLLPTFLARRKQDVVLIAKELQGGGFRAIQRLGHNLKGTGSSYGLHGITKIGRALELSAQHHDASAIELQAQELDHYLSRVRLEPS